MAYFALLWKARTIERYRLNYESEKINSIMMSKTQIPKQSLSQRWRHYRYDTKRRISRTFRKWYPEGSSISNLFLYLRTDQTFPNFVWKSVLGFVGGIVLTYLCFVFFVFQLAISLVHATIMSSIIGVLLTLGLAFSYRIRCLVFLLVPQFFSRVGRYTLTCYALVLILTGPATNTLKNSEVLTESLACGQEQIKTMVHHINTSRAKPLNSMKDSIKVMVEQLREIAVKMKRMVLKVNRLILSVSQVIQSGYIWLNSLSDGWNAKIGYPHYRKCMNSFKSYIGKHQNNPANNESSLNTHEVLKDLCSKLKYDHIWIVTEHMNAVNIVAQIKKRLKNFTERINHIFNMQVDIHHSYSFSSNDTHSASQAAAGIVTEIRRRADPLLTWLSWSSCTTSLFLLLIIFNAKHYQHMFETRSLFDNRYITKEIRDMDLKRLREGKPTILPLNRRERSKYFTTTSFRLVASEKAYLSRSVVFMTITTFKLMIHMVADYSLYWVLMTIRFHGRFQSPILPWEPDSTIIIAGSGPIANLLKGIIASLSVLLETPKISLISCLPHPYQPDFKRYSQIGVLIILLWFFALFEPYGLRMRHVVMDLYQPERAKTRAAWLYNHILRTRGSFMKLARRKLHRTYKYNTEEKYTFRRWLDSRIPFDWLRPLLGTGPDEPRCLLCGTTYCKTRPDTKLTRCNSPDCPGVYCSSCFMEIGELCTICLAPTDYGDLSDASLEKGSSDSEDSDELYSLNRQYSGNDLSICESGKNYRSISSRTSKRYPSGGLFHRNKSDANELLPLVPRRKLQTAYHNKNIDLNININNHGKTIRKATLIKHKKLYDHRYKNKEDILIFCQYCNSNHLKHFGKSYDLGTHSNNVVNNELNLSNTASNTMKKIRVRKKYARSKKQEFHRRNNKMISRSHSTPASFRNTSQSSFYQLSLSDNKLQINKINQDSKTRKKIINMLHCNKNKVRNRNSRKHIRNDNALFKNRKGGMQCKNSTAKQRKDQSLTMSNSGNTNHKANKEIDFSKGNCLKNSNGFTKPYSNTSCNIKKTRTCFGDYWKNFKSNIDNFKRVLSCNVSVITSKSNMKLNHKHRRKKKSNIKDDSVEQTICKNTDRSENESEEGRKYRIAAYLTEQAWTKRSLNYMPNIGLKNRVFSIHNLESNALKRSAVETHENRKKVSRKRIIFTGLCKKFGYDLITVTSSKTIINNILKATHRMFSGHNHVINDMANSSNAKDKDTKNYDFVEDTVMRRKVPGSDVQINNTKLYEDVMYSDQLVWSKGSSHSGKIFVLKSRGQSKQSLKQLNRLRSSWSLMRRWFGTSWNGGKHPLVDQESDTDHRIYDLSKNDTTETKKCVPNIGYTDLEGKESPENVELENIIPRTDKYYNKETYKNPQTNLINKDLYEISEEASESSAYERFQNEICQVTPSSSITESTLSLSKYNVSSSTTSTVCSLLRFRKLKMRQKGKKEVIKVDKGTETVQRKNYYKPKTMNESHFEATNKRQVVKKVSFYNVRHKEVGTDADGDKIKKMRGNYRSVKFNSNDMIIPYEDVMSPYRYLLESQRHYNELFSPRNYFVQPAFPSKDSKKRDVTQS